MSEWKAHQALIASFQALGFDADQVAYEQREFTPPTGDVIWYALSNMPGGRDPNTLGADGEDAYTGVFQISVFGPQGKGVRQVIEAAQLLTAYYTAGKSFTHDGQAVRIRKSEMSPAGRDGVRLAVAVSVYWSTAIPR